MELLNQIFNRFYTQIVEGGITFKLDIFESNITESKFALFRFPEESRISAGGGL